MKKRPIAHAREALGMTQDRFARYCGESLSVIRFREYGRRKIPRALATKLANAYGFSEACLLANRPGPALMFNGEAATAPIVKAWVDLKPDEQVLKDLAKRAARIVEGLILQAASESGRNYRQALRGLCLWIDEFGKRKPLRAGKRVELPPMTLDELKTRYPAVWRNINGWRAFTKTRIHGSAQVQVTVEARDVASPLLGAFEEDGKSWVAEIPQMLEEKITIQSCSRTWSFTCTNGVLSGTTPDN